MVLSQPRSRLAALAAVVIAAAHKQLHYVVPDGAICIDHTCRQSLLSTLQHRDWLDSGQVRHFVQNSGQDQVDQVLPSSLSPMGPSQSLDTKQAGTPVLCKKGCFQPPGHPSSKSS